MVNYPAQIDTSISLPPVIDNFTPVQGSVFNALRSAVIAIETELGVTPSGVSGTVANRLTTLEGIVGNLQIIELEQDLGGTLAEPFVIGIQGRPVSSTQPGLNQVLTWNGIAWMPEDPKGLVNVTLGGDLAGTKLSQIVVGLQTRPISANAPFAGQNLTWSGTAWTPTTPLPGFIAGGDIAGNSFTQTVIGFQGRPISSAIPSSGQALVWSGTTWAPSTLSVQNSGNYGKYLLVPIFSNIANTNSTTFVSAGTFEFDPTAITAANGTRTIKLRLVAHTTGVSMTIQLFNLTTNSTVTGTTFSTSSTTPTTIVSGDLTPNLTNGLAVYQVQILMVSGGVSDRVTLDMSSFRIDWS